MQLDGEESVLNCIDVPYTGVGPKRNSLSFSPVNLKLGVDLM